MQVSQTILELSHNYKAGMENLLFNLHSSVFHDETEDSKFDTQAYLSKRRYFLSKFFNFNLLLERLHQVLAIVTSRQHLETRGTFPAYRFCSEMLLLRQSEGCLVRKECKKCKQSTNNTESDDFLQRVFNMYSITSFDVTSLPSLKM